MNTPITLVQPCPPHQWAHAPTVGYFRCGNCGEQINYDDPRYDEMLKGLQPPSPPYSGIVVVDEADFTRGEE